MPEQSPANIILQIAGGYCLNRSLHVVAELGVADALDTTPRTAAEIAAEVNADPDALHRIMRLLAAHGVFVMEGTHFSHSPASTLLRSDHPQSMLATARMYGMAIKWASVGQLMHSVRTGESAMRLLAPEGQWAYFAEHPDESEVFNAAMTSRAHVRIAGALANYDFSNSGTICDVGGGYGHLLKAILAANPDTKGVLFELPQVLAEMSEAATPRMSLHAGSFLEDELPVCDTYVLMSVIHDWPDAESLSILQRVRRAAPIGAKLLIIEQAVADESGPDWGKTIDILMLTFFGSKQRTREEYGALLEQTGWQVNRIIPIPSGVEIVEAVAVGDFAS